MTQVHRRDLIRAGLLGGTGLAASTALIGTGVGARRWRHAAARSSPTACRAATSPPTRRSSGPAPTGPPGCGWRSATARTSSVPDWHAARSSPRRPTSRARRGSRGGSPASERTGCTPRTWTGDWRVSRQPGRCGLLGGGHPGVAVVAVRPWPPASGCRFCISSPGLTRIQRWVCGGVPMGFVKRRVRVTGPGGGWLRSMAWRTSTRGGAGQMISALCFLPAAFLRSRAGGQTP